MSSFSRNKRSLIVPLSLAAAGLIATAGCSPQAADAGGDTAATVDSVTIVSGQSAQNGELLQSIFDGYNESSDATKVELQLSADSDVETAQKVLVDIAAGAAPDAVRVTNATYQTLIDAGAAQPATSCLAGATEIQDDLRPDLVDGITVDGEIYQVPWYVTPNALFYNAELFKNAGLDPEKPPTTMDEFHQAAQAIAATGAAGGTAYFGNDYNFQTYVASLGERVYDPASGELQLDGKGATAAFQLFADMAADGSSPVYGNFFAEANEAFAGGKLGMMVTSASGYPALAAQGNTNIRMAPVPAMAGGEQIAASSTNGFVITTKDPARQAAVCDALLSVLTPEAVTETVSATATIPLRESVVDNADFLAPVYEANPDWIKVREQQTFPWASLPGGANAEYTGAYLDAQTLVLRGEGKPADVAADLQQTTTELLNAN